MKEKVVLAYSGGLDTSIIVPWLKENYDFQVIAVCLDVGQEDNMEEVKTKAIKTGANKVYIEDLKEELVTEYLFKGIKSGAVYEGKYLLGTAFARPLMAKRLVEIAHLEDAKYICHGCTGKGNDQVRFEVSIASFDPTIKIIAPWRTWNIKSREDAIDYAKSKEVEVPVTKEKIYSRDQNLWHISHEGGNLEDPRNEHDIDLYMRITPPEKAPNSPQYVEIYFEKGVPTKIDGVVMKPIDLLDILNKMAGKNGIGIIDIVENRLVGMKSRGVYETPGGTVLYFAHDELERLTLDKQTYHFKQMIGQKYGELLYDGLWFTTLRESLDAFIDITQQTVTGTVKLKLYKGNITCASIDSPYTLYNEEISSFDTGELFNHKDSTGFINIYNLPFKIKAMVNNK
ncbi:argininosuccinate synthase [Clostridium sp. D2Q-14]|uniref:argininosuccinate synthase n=1 Tax=Anaeromonas gelatinilytica TaxID=2683194 RepID=UPI00193C54CE|nr:argininosuccinate synthase [Anaeromonas gelatinilytica]MBS4535334.1 argininosuccinate synthase [Anaeromonas gelatinilytica]